MEHNTGCDYRRVERAIISPSAATPMSHREITNSKIRRNRHREMLILSAIVITLSCLLEVGEAGRVFFKGFPNWPVPQTCMSRDLFGVECPGCGLTRSYIHLMHGHWNDAWEMHRIGWLLFIATVFQLPYRLIALRIGDRELIPIQASRWIGSGLIALLIANWLIGLWNLH